MAETITIRRYQEGDRDAVLDVMRDALGETTLLRRTPELFAWKHIDNPFGRSLMLVADAGGRIAGFRAFMRWELETPGGEAIRCVRAVDTATHPDFMRRGIFKQLTLAAVDAASDDGVDLIFNTPNPKSGAGYLKMGWVPVGDIGVMIFPTYRMLRRRQASDALPDVRDFLEGKAIPAEGLREVRRPARGLRTVRSAAYLQWRFGNHPTARYYRVDADGSTAIVRPNVRNNRRELVVSELLGPRPAKAASTARRSSSSDYLATWFSPGSPERAGALRAGFLPIPRRALTLVAHPLRDLEIDVASLDSWDLALGDLELL